MQGINTKKRVFFISRDANWQLYRNEIFSYLGKNYRVDVEILTTGEIKSYIKDNNYLSYVRFFNWLPYNSKMNFFPGALWYILRNKPDCVIGQNNVTNLTEYLAVIMCRLAGVKFLWWTHGYEHKPIESFGKRVVKNLYVRFFLKLADGIITYSKAGTDYIVNTGIKDSHRVFLAPNTLDTSQLAHVRETITSDFDRISFIKQIFPTAGLDSKFLLFSGRINKYKKVENLIKAMPVILETDPNVYLMVVGDGYRKEQCIKLANSLNVVDHIYFQAGTFDPFEVGKFFTLADLFVMPGLVGLAIVHAFSFGLPLITEDINYHSPEIQYLKDGKNGFLVKEDNVIGLASKILEIVNNPGLLASLSNEALKTVREEANIDFMIESMYKAVSS